MKGFSANASGKVFSDHRWLDAHHAVKSRLRAELVSQLPIHPGDKVLDLGCGPGTWALLLADKVGLHGSVLGVDVDEDSIHLARDRSARHYLRSIVSFEAAEIETLPLAPESFDVILLFNTLSLLAKPNRMLGRLLGALRPGGRIFIKDTDLQTNVFWPDPGGLLPRIIGRLESSSSHRIGGHYDPFFARRIPSLIEGLDARMIAFTQSFSLFHPLLDEEVSYVNQNAEMLAIVMDEIGESQLAEVWRNWFDMSASPNIYDNADFMFTMTEFIFQLTPLRG